MSSSDYKQCSCSELTRANNVWSDNHSGKSMLGSDATAVAVTKLLKAQASHVERQELEFPPSQMNDLQNVYLALHNPMLSITRVVQGLALTQIMFHIGCWWSGLPVGQHYKVAKSDNCHKSVPVLIGPQMLPGCKTPTSK